MTENMHQKALSHAFLHSTTILGPDYFSFRISLYFFTSVLKLAFVIDQPSPKFE